MVAVAVLTSAAAWATRPAPLTGPDALAEVRHALAAAGLEAEVASEVEPGTYVPEDGSPLEVWKTRAEVDGEELELWITRRDGRAAYLDDRVAEGGGHLLTDEQLSALAEDLDDPRWSRIVRRAAPVSVAGALVVVVALLLAASERRPPLSPPPTVVHRPRRREPLRAKET